MKNTRKNWKPMGFPSLVYTTSSGDLYEIPLEAGPDWAMSVPNLEGLYLARHATRYSTSTGNLTTSDAIATLTMERLDPRTGKWKNYYYPQIAMRDGRIFQAGPIKKINCGHHRKDRISLRRIGVNGQEVTHQAGRCAY